MTTTSSRQRDGIGKVLLNAFKNIASGTNEAYLYRV